MREPVTTLDPRYSDPSAGPTTWEETRRQLETAELSWLVTVRPDGRPHATPVVAVWVDDALHFTTGEKEQKGANLRAGDRVLLQAGRLDWEGGIDVVVEGQAKLAVDETLLRRLATAWQARWDGRWKYEVRDGRLHHPGGFAVLTYSVHPEKVLAFAEGTFGHTLHRFPPV
ncbi:MAG: pyridoxamine 5'-phosphate oxidase family protein [Acidimicrobiales bacterium]|jgi:nitroimidazol reductase NimA-like FMN-containing flavoprotein (pyridoxamine 5'-phosphate oxidase superfamily)